jgi:hypothetical protein
MVNVAFATILSGGLITTYGYFVPFLLLGGSIITVATGLIFTWTTNTPASKWIGYQVLAGIGNGLAFQVPMIATQGVSANEDISAATAIALCKCL